MFFKLRTSALSIHFALILFGILLNWSCQPYEETKHLQASGAIQDSLFRYTESEGVHISMFEKGYRYLEISSNFAKTHQSSSENFTIFSGNVNINLFDSLLALKSAVVCSTATYNNITNTSNYIKYGNNNINNNLNKYFTFSDIPNDNSFYDFFLSRNTSSEVARLNLIKETTASSGLRAPVLFEPSVIKINTR